MVKKGNWYKFLRVGHADHTSFYRSRHKSALSSRQGIYTADALKKEMKNVLAVTAAMSKKHNLVFISDQIRNETDLNELRYAMPICISKKPEACASLGSEGQPFSTTAPGAFDFVF